MEETSSQESSVHEIFMSVCVVYTNSCQLSFSFLQNYSVMMCHSMFHLHGNPLSLYVLPSFWEIHSRRMSGRGVRGLK